MIRTFSVPGMTCRHCKSRIHSSLSETPEVESVTVDLEGKTVTVESGLESARVIALINEAGYDAEELSGES